MDDFIEVVNLVEDFAHRVLEYMPFPREEYDDYFVRLTKDIYIYTLKMFRKFSH